MRDLYEQFLAATSDEDDVIKAVRALVKREVKRLEKVGYNRGRPRLEDTPDRAKWRGYKRKT